jgi:hypothetical protein
MFTTLAATINVVIYKKIFLRYSLYVQIMTAFGTLPGIFFQAYAIKVTGRVSTQVFLLISCLSLATVSIFVLTIPTLIHKAQMGAQIFALAKYCPE